MPSKKKKIIGRNLIYLEEELLRICAKINSVQRMMFTNDNPHNENQQLEDLSFELYGNGLTTSQIGNVMHKIYGKHYSKSAISNITSTFSEQMGHWRNRPLDTCYLGSSPKVVGFSF